MPDGELQSPTSPQIHDINVPLFEPHTRDGLEQYVESEVDKCTYMKMTFFRDDVFNQLKRFKEDCKKEITKTLDLE